MFSTQISYPLLGRAPFPPKSIWATSHTLTAPLEDIAKFRASVQPGQVTTLSSVYIYWVGVFDSLVAESSVAYSFNYVPLMNNYGIGRLRTEGRDMLYFGRTQDFESLAGDPPLAPLNEFRSRRIEPGDLRIYIAAVVEPLENASLIEVNVMTASEAGRHSHEAWNLPVAGLLFWPLNGSIVNARQSVHIRRTRKLDAYQEEYVRLLYLDP